MIDPSPQPLSIAENAVVQKFGGSSLASPKLRRIAAQRVVEAIESGRKPVAVVSAQGRAPAPYATDTLLGLLGEDAAGPEQDLVLACGEIISAVIFATLLRKLGLQARALTGAQAGIITTHDHGNADIVQVDPATVIGLLQQDVVPVVAGFQGVTADGAVTTLGRGGSDLTAVVLAAALGNADLEIYTDVDGILSADPRRFPTARTVHSLTHDDLSALAHNGAKVMHSKAADFARAAGMELQVLGLESRAGSRVSRYAIDADAGRIGSLATASGFAFVHVLWHQSDKGSWKRTVLSALAAAELQPLYLSVALSELHFVVPLRLAKNVNRILKGLSVAHHIQKGCARIVVVGATLRDAANVRQSLVDELAERRLSVLSATNSLSSITLIVPDEHAREVEHFLIQKFSLA